MKEYIYDINKTDRLHIEVGKGKINMWHQSRKTEYGTFVNEQKIVEISFKDAMWFINSENE